MEKMMEQNRFYVYFLVDTNDVVRYVGKGTASRFKNTKERTKVVEAFMNSSDFSHSIIVKNGMTNSEAIHLENLYLTKYLGKDTDKFKLLNVKGAEMVKELSSAYLSNYFKIDDDSPSGLTWIVDRPGNNGGKKTRAGSFAGSLSKRDGYYRVILDGSSFLAHRIVYCLHHKLDDLDKEMLVNHIDGVRSNNNVNNLELVTALENSQRTVCKPKGGIRWHKRDCCWEVRWSENFKQRGKYFKPKDFGSIELARLEAEKFLAQIQKDVYRLSVLN